MTARSTILGLLARHCPHAVTLAAAGAPYDRTIFAAGIAAHAVLQDLGTAAERYACDDPEAIADATAHTLATIGRSFDGVAEPPLPVEAVLEGKRLALLWWALNPWPPGGQPEIGLAVDDLWRPIGYHDPRAYVRGILDLRYPAVEDLNGEPADGLAHDDYKSAWPAKVADLDSIQIKIQTVLVLAHAKEMPAFIRQGIANLRTGILHTRTIWLDDDGHTMISNFKRDIAAAIRVLHHEPRLPSPGACCQGCPYLLDACTAGRQAVQDSADDATRLAVLDAQRGALRARLKLATAERPHPVPGGRVGYVGQVSRALVPDAAVHLAAAWFSVAPEAMQDWLAAHADWTALLSAMGATMGGLNAAAAAIYPYRRGDGGEYKRAREALIEKLSTRTVTVRFGVWPDVPAEDEEE